MEQRSEPLSPSLLALIQRTREIGQVAVGYSATFRLKQKREAQLVLIAQDTEIDMLRPLADLCEKSKIYYAYIQSREILAQLLQSRRSTSCGALAASESHLLDGLLGDSPATLPSEPTVHRVEVGLWFHSLHFQYLLDGRKRGTLRVGRRVPASLYLPVLETETRSFRGSVIIETLSWLRWGDVSGRPDVLACEWPNNWPDLQLAMRNTYGTLGNADWMTFYGFMYMRD